MVAQHAGTPPPSSMLLSGIVPPLADSFYQRPESGLALRSGLYPGDTVVLIQDEPTAAGPAGQGGTGKTQLAVSYAYALWSIRAVEVLVWVTAANREAIVTGFAEAARTVGAGIPGDAGNADEGRNADEGGLAELGLRERGPGEPGPGEPGPGEPGLGDYRLGDQRLGAEEAAERFAVWMAATGRRWALILDDLRDPADLEQLWPAGPAGQVVITTRLSGQGLDALASVAGRNSAAGRRSRPPNLRIAPVGGFTQRETLSYLSSRLTDYPGQRLEAVELGEDLDGLPLGLAQAAAVMKLSGLSCREYRAQFAERRAHMSGVRVDGVSAAMLATWSLAAECAHRLAPAGLAWPALALAALLDTHGVPAAVLTSPAACSYITGRPSTVGGNDRELVRAALTNLAGAGLISLDPASPVRTVRMHRCVQAAVRGYLPAPDLEPAILAAADALLQAWPESAGQAPLAQAQLAQAQLVQAQLVQAQLVQALRDCTAALRAVQIGTLWRGQAHPLLFRAGISLQDSGLTESAIAYWQTMLLTSTRMFGSGNADAVAARDRLAAAYESAGRFGDAIAVFQSALAERERKQGYEHPDTIAARGQLARAYASAGQPAAAATVYEQVIAAAGRQLGLGHPVTLTARAHLAEAYLTAGRSAESIATYQMLLADAERILGLDHPMTVTIRENLDHART